MSGTSVQIKRPRLLGGLAALAMSAAITACFGLFAAADRLAAGPIRIEAGAERLEATLADSSGAAAVWAVTSDACANCMADAVGAELAAMRAEGYDVRVVRLSPAAYAALDAVLRENGEALDLPAVFWRRGEEWRGVTSLDPRACDVLRAEFNPEA